MADNEQQVVLLDAANLAENGEIVTIAQSSGVGGQAVSDDILQQALEEATESYGNTVVEYTPDNLTVVADGSVLTDHNTVAAGSVVVSEDSYSLVNAVEDGMETGDIHIQHDTVSVDGPFEAQIVESVSGIEMTAGTEMISVAGGTVNGEGLVVENPGAVPIATVVQTVSGSPPSPLGSSNNPIRIIQQGNQYTSMQQLTPEQLAQIMQVVQEQQLAKTTSAANGSTTLFNPQTQTRIIYRVIYPSELHAKTGGPRPVTIQVPQSMHHQKRVYRKRVKDEDADKLDGPELSREEKEQRKKQRPRTRAGRVSRPPKHMVQDYKHIHPLDWDEDYDDSDGGYSDFKMSDEEPEDETRGDETFVHGGWTHWSQCIWKTYMVHQTFVRWALHILHEFVESLVRCLDLAVRNVNRFLPTMWSLGNMPYDLRCEIFELIMWISWFLKHHFIHLWHKTPMMINHWFR